jgi:hypothetical protein
MARREDCRVRPWLQAHPPTRCRRKLNRLEAALLRGGFIATAPSVWDSEGQSLHAVNARLPRRGFIMSLFDVLAWGFVGFTALLCGGVGWLWWLERHTERP